MQILLLLFRENFVAMTLTCERKSWADKKYVQYYILASKMLTRNSPLIDQSSCFKLKSFFCSEIDFTRNNGDEDDVFNFRNLILLS